MLKRGNVTLGVPTLLLPTTGYTTADLTTTFTWTAVLGATSYRIQIATDAGFMNVIETGTPAGTSYTSVGLTAGQTYYWRVRATAEGGTEIGAYTAGYTLKTLGTVTLSTPADTSFTTDTTPTFDWADVTNATGYIIEIATTNTFGATIVETGTPAVSTYTSAGLSADGWYYWRVRPTAEAGVEVGSNSSTWSLELFNFRDCLSYDGTNDYCLSASGVSNYKNQTKIEVGAWINLTYRSGTAVQCIIHLLSATTPASNDFSFVTMNVDANTFKLRLAVKTGNATYAYAQTNNAFNYGTNYFVYLTFSSGTVHIYVNGNDEAITYSGAAMYSSTFNYNCTVYAGFYSLATGYVIKGKMDHMAVRYNRTVLTSTEAALMYNSGNGRRYQEVAIFDTIWEFNEGAGGTVADTGATTAITLNLADAPATPTWTTWA